MNERKQARFVAILVIVIIVLLLFIAYAFWIKPSINGYVIKKQNEAKDIVLNTILLQIQQQGYAQISDAQGNSLVLVPLKQGTQPQQTTQQPNTSTK